MYKVLWFDDEFAELELIADEALQYGVELVGYSNAEEGVEELQKNYTLYSAVVLDGLFFRKSGMEGDQVDQEAFGIVAKELSALKNKDVVIPWFIYSGQPSFVKDNNQLVNIFKDNQFAKGRVFDKNGDNDLEELCEEIKDSVEAIDSIRIQHQFADVFEICKENYLGEEVRSRLINLISEKEKRSTRSNDHELFNPIRKILEKMFHKMNSIGLVPDDIVQNSGWISGVKWFIKGTHKEFQLEEEFVNPIIVFQIEKLLDLTQDASHGEGNLKYRVDEYVMNSSNNYLYTSCVYQLLDILVWFKSLVDENPDKEKNILKWSRKESTNQNRTSSNELVLSQDSDGNYHCEDVIFAYSKVHDKYELGSRVEIYETAANNNDRNKHMYPKFAVSFRIIPK